MPEAMSDWGRDMACFETCSEASLQGPKYSSLGRLQPRDPPTWLEEEHTKNLLVLVLLRTLLVAVSKTTRLVMKCNLYCFSWQSAVAVYGFNYGARTQITSAGMLGVMLPVDSGEQVVN